MELTQANISSFLNLLLKILNSDDQSFFSSIVQVFLKYSSFEWNPFTSNKPTLTKATGTSNVFKSQNQDDHNGDEDPIICMREMEMVMHGILGVDTQKGLPNSGQQRFGVTNFSTLFDEEEPSLQEIREAFEVFDLDKNGFIDVEELHRVICCLGLKQRFGLEECRKMIRVYDVNGDGFIDFREFVKLMEKCLCC